MEEKDIIKAYKQSMQNLEQELKKINILMQQEAYKRENFYILLFVLLGTTLGIIMIFTVIGVTR